MDIATIRVGTFRFSRRSWLVLGLCFTTAFVATDYFLISQTWDWFIFREATYRFFTLRSPYFSGFYNPPWILPPLLPFALLPAKIGGVLFSALDLALLLLVAYRLKARSLALVLLCLSPVIFTELRSVNINGLVALGLILPPQIGLFFLLAKPQVGIFVAIFWLVETWRQGGYWKVVRVFAPVSIAFGLSIILYGPWPQYSFGAIGQVWNISPWPWGIPAGIGLMILAIRQRQLSFALLATPFLTPYLAFHTLIFPILGLAINQTASLLAFSGLWGYIALRGGFKYL